MADKDFSKIARGLWNAASMSADQLAEKKGEADLFVRIKCNSERLDGCPGHEFDSDPEWRSTTLLTGRTVHCRVCGGDMKMHDAMNYLRGYAHGSGRDFKAMTDAIWPPSV